MNDTLTRSRVETYIDPDMGKSCEAVDSNTDEDCPNLAVYRAFAVCDECAETETSLFCKLCMNVVVQEDIWHESCEAKPQNDYAGYSAYIIIYYEEIK